jgi:hypothetical protein
MDEKELLKMKENNDEDLASRVWIETMKAMASLGFSGFSSVCSSVIDSKRGWKILFEVWKLEILKCINQKIWHQYQGSENLRKQVSQIFDLG